MRVRYVGSELKREYVGSERKREQVFLFADRYAIEEGKAPSNRAVWAHVKGDRDTIASALLEFKANPPGFLTVEDKAMRSFAAFDLAAQEANDVVQRTMTQDEPSRAVAAEWLWRLFHRRAVVAGCLVAMLPALPPLLRDTVSAICRQLDYPDGDIRELLRVDRKPPEEVTALMAALWPRIQEFLEKSSEPVEKQAGHALEELQRVALTARRQGQCLYVQTHGQPWFDPSLTGMSYCAGAREDEPLIEALPDDAAEAMQRVISMSATGWKVGACNVGRSSSLTLLDAALIAGCSVRALKERIRRAKETGQEQSFHVPISTKGEWAITDASTLWPAFSGWMKTWTGKSRTRRRRNPRSEKVS